MTDGRLGFVEALAQVMKLVGFARKEMCYVRFVQLLGYLAWKTARRIL